ncbi:MAG: GGDEF domain-containing protein, partial [Sphingomonadales bacterium]|nr:GGDEF domain-containing protein [Sphingomonadales bacterium]
FDGDLDRAREAAEHDHLTGLLNRRGFERRVADRLHGDTGTARRMAIALCDIDDFKRVNDIHGHQTGDRVLNFVGRFLADELGNTACVARYGGEEFAVLIDGNSVHEAVMLLDEARERLAARSLVNQDTGAPIGQVTFSAGVAAFTDNVSRALGAADAALYRAKRGGKNTVQIAPAGA